LGFGTWPLFADSRFEGSTAAPFLRWEDVERLDPAAVWNALN
jgi:O-succinylbenzoate synthase